MEIEEMRQIIGTLAAKIKASENNDFEKSPNNIFQILGIETNEVLACRFLGYLLKQKANNSGTKSPLSYFLSDVLDVNDELKDGATVVLEDVIDERRRVDIVIKNGTRVYPIEVKIRAGDQETQLEDYYTYYFRKRNYKGKKIYYLTPTKWSPSDKSKGSLKVTDYMCLSFKEHIVPWLKRIMEEGLVSHDFQPMVHQFLEVIQEMCAQEDEREQILCAFDLDNGKEFIYTEEIELLVALLRANGDTNGILQKEIQKRYLKRYLDCGSDHECIYDTNYKSDDSHALLYIRRVGQTDIIASVCVDTNLYLRNEKGTIPGEDWKDETWVYIQPKGYKEKYPLKDCSNVKNTAIIPIFERLKEIEMSLK